jgi:hypothetical protein
MQTYCSTVALCLVAYAEWLVLALAHGLKPVADFRSETLSVSSEFWWSKGVV